MLDIRFIRENAELVQKKAKQKGYDIDVKKLLELDEKRRDLIKKSEELRAERNELVHSAKGQKPGEIAIESGKKFKQQLTELEKKLKPIDEQYWSLLKSIPNMPTDDVPVGATEDENVVSKEWGEKPKFDFEPKNHWEIAENRDLIDKDRAAKIAGTRFAYIKGDLVKLQFAIMQFVVNTLSNETVIKQIVKDNNLNISTKPFVPILPPAVVKTEPYEASGRLNAEEITYKLADDDLWLNASAEHSLCTMYANETLPADKLPIRYIGYSTSFRREAGTYGKDTEGILRMHQFDKLEMEVFSDAKTGRAEHELLIAIQEYLMQQLNITYQLITKCTADIGGPNARGVDINAWMPGQDKYRETHTADYMTDYQARSLQTRVKTDDSTDFVHTNDATAFALGRIMIAIIENYQNADGTIRIPDVLQPYMAGQKTL